MNMKIFLLAAALLTGCAAPKAWYKDGNNRDQFERDKAECFAKAYQAVPPLPSPPPAQVTGYNSDCYRSGQNVYCTTTPQIARRDNLMDSFYRGQAQADNSIGRDAMANSCLYSKGYYLK